MILILLLKSGVSNQNASLVTSKCLECISICLQHATLLCKEDIETACPSSIYLGYCLLKDEYDYSFCF